MSNPLETISRADRDAPVHEMIHILNLLASLIHKTSHSHEETLRLIEGHGLGGIFSEKLELHKLLVCKFDEQAKNAMDEFRRKRDSNGR